MFIDGREAAASPVMRVLSPAWRFDVPIPAGAKRIVMISLIEIVRSNATHVVLTGVTSTPFRVTSPLYKNRRLAPTVVPLLQEQVEGQGVMEPVAWVNTAEDRRAFYTSLGNVDDFRLPAFRRLLLNGILWCLHDPVPPPTR